jgi:hypothetical protein
MRRALCPAIGWLLLAAYGAYALLGVRTEGPADKIAQLLVLVPGILCLAWWVSARWATDLAKRMLQRLDRIPARPFLAGLCLALFLFTLWMAYGPLEGTAKGGDEAGTLFQARIYAGGELAAPAPPDPETYFPCRHLVVHEGKWFGQYTPTHSVLLAPLVAAGASPLLGPLEGVLSLIGVFLLVRLWAGERVAKLVALLMILSPFFLMMTPTHMAHNSNLMLTVWSMYLLSRYWRTGRFSLSLGAGVLLGLALTTKPYPIVVLGLFLLGALIRGGRKGLLGIAGLAAGAAPLVVGMLLLNRYYTGDPLTTPYQLARPGRLLGFGENKAWYPTYGDYTHTVWRGLKDGIRQVASGATMLFGWPLVSLVPLAASIPLLRRERRLAWLFAMLPVMFVFLLAHAWPATIYGPRHYYVFLPVVLYLSLRGLGLLYGLARRRWEGRGGSFLLLALAGLFGITVVLYIPERVREMSGPWLTIDSAPRRTARQSAEPPAVIFMEASQHGYPNIYSGLNHTSPFLDSPFVFCAHQTPEEDRAFMERFPDRGAYLYYVDRKGRHRVEPWTEELARELTPERRMHLESRPPPRR